ncbi:hypothetical protein ACFVZE_29935 [Streptomyces anulatus]|uniref:hypothetical protein n=1 Tax=Streptomyces anulatus TaxID=1892 RepID=UPI0036D86DF1
MEHVLGDDWRAAAVLALSGGGVESFEGGDADALLLGLRHRGEERKQQPRVSSRASTTDPTSFSTLPLSITAR